MICFLLRISLMRPTQSLHCVLLQNRQPQHLSPNRAWNDSIALEMRLGSCKKLTTLCWKTWQTCLGAGTNRPFASVVVLLQELPVEQTLSQETGW